MHGKKPESNTLRSGGQQPCQLGVNEQVRFGLACYLRRDCPPPRMGHVSTTLLNTRVPDNPEPSRCSRPSGSLLLAFIVPHFASLCIEGMQNYLVGTLIALNVLIIRLDFRDFQSTH